MKTKLDVLKFAVSFVVGAGTSKITHAIISNNINPQTTYDAVTTAGGSLVIGMMAAEATRDYTDAKIDAAATWVNENVNLKS